VAPSGVVVKRPPVDVIMALEVVEKLSLNSRQVPIFRPDTEKRPLWPAPCHAAACALTRLFCAPV